MKRRYIVVGGIIVIAAIIIMGVCNRKNMVSAEYADKYSETFGEFTAKTTGELLKGKKENTCYSPVSLFGALCMFAELTEGDTRQEALEVMGFDSITELEKNYEQMLGDIDVDTNEERITLANSLWLVANEISKEVDSGIANIEEKLAGEIFIKDKIYSDEVNGWVNEKTNGLIPEICYSDDERMALVNALYYKSGWAVDISEWNNEMFYPEDGGSEKVTYLFAGRERLNYNIEDGYTFVEVPLNNGSAILVLPDEDVDLQKILEEKELNEILADATNGSEKKQGLVNIKFPEFNISDEMGTQEIFNALKANGASGDWESPDWVGELQGEELEIVQKTELDVNKDGIEAAAVTGMFYQVVGIGDSLKVDLDITYDRPFLYILIKDGVPLFIGTVYNPAQ